MIAGKARSAIHTAKPGGWPVLLVTALTGLGGALLLEVPSGLSVRVASIAGISAPLVGAGILLVLLVGGLFRLTMEAWGQNAALLETNRQLACTKEELRQARDAALESVRLKSQFLATMSHEIRTPLNGVIGMADLLVESGLTHDQLETTELLRGSADGLLTIVNDILDFSKMEAGMMRIENIDFALRNVIESTAELLADTARRKAVEMTTLVTSDVPDMLRGDPSRVRQILTNLIGNAIKFTPAGDVTVRVTREAGPEDRVTVRFEVSDTGIGIPPEAQSRLFQPFVQADGSTARRFGGTGLGLAISRQIVERLGGEISFESEPDKGSRFWFSLPFEVCSPVKVGAAAGESRLIGSRLLVVDDSTTTRSMLAQHAAHWMMHVEAVGDGAAALESLLRAQIDGKPFDVLITDLLLPDMTGFELARAVLADPQRGKPRVILMPSFGKRGHAQDAREAGISAYLVKPVKEHELLDCLLAVITDPHPAPGRGRLVTRHSIAEARPGTPRVLIAEDNPVNQKLLVAHVTKLGLRSDIVDNGARALDAMERTDYSLVLMDCQMPVLDGYEATRQLRGRESGGVRTPVIAVTANALAGDRERCIAAGMDDYLTKPIRRDTLRIVLERWLPAGSLGGDGGPHRVDVASVVRAAGGCPGAPKAEPEPTHGNPEVPQDLIRRLDELRTECGSEVLGDLVQIFLDDAGDGIRQMRDLLAAQDAEALERQAHTLKGSSVNMGAQPLAHVFSTIECRAEAGELQGLEESIEEAVIRLEGVRKHLESWARPDLTHAS